MSDITLWDMFAAAALAGISVDASIEAKTCARWAAETADEMMALRLERLASKTENVATELPPNTPWKVYTNAMRLRIGDTYLTARPSKCLASVGIFTVDELLRYPSKLLMEIRNFGATSLMEVEDALQAIGNKLPDRS